MSLTINIYARRRARARLVPKFVPRRDWRGVPTIALSWLRRTVIVRFLATGIRAGAVFHEPAW